MALRCGFVFLAAVTLAAQQPYSIEKEAVLGDRLAQHLRQSTTALESPAVREYVQRIGDRLAAQLTTRPTGYTFSVIADDRGGPTHEPLWFPGGYIFVPASLILTARDEPELAGMLAHTMAHVAERHGFRPATRNGEMPMWFLEGDDDSLTPIGYRSIRRVHETEADALAVKLSSGAGYDPSALVRYIGRTDARESRIAGIENAMRELPPKTYSSAAAEEFARLQDEVRRAAVR